ncbi:unnamed protein product [Allacma fusca]|uniref:Uncharacterized protein n=1 Tax=Allacma fusca TaxID=39272 RepID=A0A8J2L206_9HEXA|nr:unnamed protein product [Allacma fusca]
MADPKLSLRGHKGYLTRLRNFIVAINPHTATRSNHVTYFKNIADTKAKIDCVVQELYERCADEAEADAVTKETEPIFDELCKLQEMLDTWNEEIIKKETTTTAGPSPANAAIPQAQVTQKPKLPQLTLPKYLL